MTIEIQQQPAPIERVFVCNSAGSQFCEIWPSDNGQVMFSRSSIPAARLAAPAAALTADEVETLANALLAMVETMRTA